MLKVLSPLVCRALAISDVLDIRILKSEMVEKTRDGLVAGVFLTARDGRVVYMNAVAERQVKTGNSIRVVNNRIVLSSILRRGWRCRRRSRTRRATTPTWI